jgi:integrase
MTLDEARKKARRWRTKADDGIDPKAEEDGEENTRRTFSELTVQYIEEYAKPRKKTWETDEGRLDRHIPASWRRRKVADITREDVETLHASIGKTRPYEANRMVDLMSVVFRQARRWKYVEPNAPNPAADIDKFPEEKRKRFARPDELPLIAEGIDLEEDVYVRGALWSYLLTGARKNELLPRRRDEVEWDFRRLRLPDTKSGEEQYLTLNAAALAIIQALPKVEGNPYIFVGRNKGQHLINISKPWLRVRARATVKLWERHEDKTVSSLVAKLAKEFERQPTHQECVAAASAEEIDLPAGLTDIRIHDLRRTVGSYLTQADVDLNKVKEALRHSSISTTLTYARLGSDPVREAMEDHGKRVMEIAGRVRAVDGGE